MPADHKTFGLGGLRLDVNDLRWILVFLIAGIAWGLKLEFRIDGAYSNVNARIDLIMKDHAEVDARVADIEHTIGAGVLPRTEERLVALQKESAETHANIEALRKEVAELSVSVRELRAARAR